MSWTDNGVIDKHVELLRSKGFDVNPKDDRQRMFFCQFNIWLDIFGIDCSKIALKDNIFRSQA